MCEAVNIYTRFSRFIIFYCRSVYIQIKFKKVCFIFFIIMHYFINGYRSMFSAKIPRQYCSIETRFKYNICSLRVNEKLYSAAGVIFPACLYVPPIIYKCFTFFGKLLSINVASAIFVNGACAHIIRFFIHFCIINQFS